MAPTAIRKSPNPIDKEASSLAFEAVIFPVLVYANPPRHEKVVRADGRRRVLAGHP